MTPIQATAGTTAPFSAASRPFQRLMQAGSIASRVVRPSPATLGVPATQVVRRRAAAGDPIVLVGGYASMPSSLRTLQASLQRDGFRNVFIFAVPENGLADIRASAQALREFVARVKLATGTTKVDLVAHSAGGVVARTMSAQVRGRGIDSIITIATPHHGIEVFGSATLSRIAATRFGAALFGPATAQLQQGSELLQWLNGSAVSAQQARAGVRLVSIYLAGFDGLLTPVNTAVVEGATNIKIASTARMEHFTVHRRSDAAYHAVRGALLATTPLV